jgi:hypothetical protein
LQQKEMSALLEYQTSRWPREELAAPPDEPVDEQANANKIKEGAGKDKKQKKAKCFVATQLS